MHKRAVGIIVAGFLTIFVSFAIRYAYGLLMPEMLPFFGISKAEAGIVYASYFIAYTVCSPILGLLVDRTDARLLLTVFVAILGAGAFLMSISTSVVHASLFFTLAGIGMSAGWVPVVTVVQRWVDDHHRGTAIAIVDLGSGLGIVSVSLVLPLIVGGHGWQTGWVCLGGFTFMVAVLNFIFIRSHPPVNHQIENKPRKVVPILSAYGELMQEKTFWFIGLSYMLMGFCILIPFAFLTTYATQELNIPYSSAASLLAVIAVAGICGKLLLAHLSDTLGRVIMMMLCGAFTAIGGMGMALTTGHFGLAVFAAVFGIGYGAIWPLYAAASRDFFPQEYAGSVVGLWTVYLGIGSIVSPILAGWTIDRSGSYLPAFMLTVISGVMAMLLLIPIISQKRVGKP